MNNQNFYLRLIALLLIIMAVFFYNGTVKDKEQAQNIADLTAKSREPGETSRTRSLQHYRKLMKNRKQQQKVMLLLMPLQKLIIKIRKGFCRG